MLFLVRLYSGGALVWECQVEAEDREGAEREALALCEAGGGQYVNRVPMLPPFTLDIDALERDPGFKIVGSQFVATDNRGIVWPA